MHIVCELTEYDNGKELPAHILNTSIGDFASEVASAMKHDHLDLKIKKDKVIITHFDMSNNCKSRKTYYIETK